MARHLLWCLLWCAATALLAPPTALRRCACRAAAKDPLQKDAGDDEDDAASTAAAGAAVAAAAAFAATAADPLLDGAALTAASGSAGEAVASPPELALFGSYLFYGLGYLLVDRRDHPICASCTELALVKARCTTRALRN